MGMYSGIGSFAKRFQEGGEAQNGSGSGLGTIGDDSGSSSTTGAPLSYEQFIAAFPSGPGGLINGMTKQQAYQAYLTAYNAGFTGPNFNFTGRGGVNTGTGNQNTLPPYLSINPETGLAVIPVGTTNSQFVEAMKILGLIPEEDYKWLSQYFTGEGGEQTWLCLLYTSDAADE